MLKILCVIATRPDAIKMCPLINKLKEIKEFRVITVSTGQHKEMLDEVLDIFKVVPDDNLEIMKKEQTLFSITDSVLSGMKNIYEKYNPDLVLVHGDTTSAFVSALAAYYKKIPVGHIEAGLRTYDKYSPYPEEFNRVAIDHISSYCFAPTEQSKINLIKEGIEDIRISVTGNTIVDALKITSSYGNCDEIIKWANGRKILLLTAHRRENLGEKMEDIFNALGDFLKSNKDYCCVYPVHPNPSVKRIAEKHFKSNNSVLLKEPMNVNDFHKLISISHAVLTDSGGIQEEAPTFSVPVIVCRDTTERPEGIESGVSVLCSCHYEKIRETLDKVLLNKCIYSKMKKSDNPYGDGFACERICDIIKNELL